MNAGLFWPCSLVNMRDISHLCIFAVQEALNIQGSMLETMLDDGVRCVMRWVVMEHALSLGWHHRAKMVQRSSVLGAPMHKGERLRFVWWNDVGDGGKEGLLREVRELGEK